MSGFGGSKPAGGFGASTGGGFGSSAGGGFGSSTGGGFGSSTGGAFGSAAGGTNANKSGTGFGTAGKTGLGGFSSTGGFGSSAAKAFLKDDNIFRRLVALRAAYNQRSPAYEFCYVFYDPKGETTNFPARPENFTESAWVDVCMKMPDPEHLIPHPVYGFEGLEMRRKRQEELRDKLLDSMSKLHAKLRELTLFYATKFTGSFERIRQNQIMIQQQLMEVVEIEEVQQHQGKKLSPDEDRMLKKLEQLNLDISKPERYANAIKELELRVRESAAPVSGAKMTVDKVTLKVFVDALKANQEALEALQRAAKSLKKDVEKLKSMSKPMGS